MIAIIQIPALFLSFFFISITAYAEQGMDGPIDASCFYNLEADTHTIDLRHCGLKHHKFVKTGENSELLAKGYKGFNWKDPTANWQGYSYYKYFKAADNAYWVFTLNNGGGNAESTDLYWVKKDDSNTLSIKYLMGGNRCNGGIQEVHKKNDRLRFSVNLTAYALIRLSKNQDKSMKSIDDLADCAVCCVAKAVYELKAKSPQLQYIDFGDRKNPDQMPTQGKHQACLNTVLTSSVAKGKNRLNPAQLDEFVLQFIKDCTTSELPPSGDSKGQSH